MAKQFVAHKGVITLILIALALRLWGLNFGLPYMYHPDEPRYVISAQRLFQTHNLDPNSLPDIASSSFIYVLNALAYIPYYLMGKLFGLFNNPTDIPAPTMLVMGTGFITRPSVFLLGRWLTLSFSLANVLLTFIIGREWLDSKTAGFLAALFLAISPSHVSHSRYITPDTFTVFFSLLFFWLTIRLAQKESPTIYALAGIGLGCLLSTKISGALIILPLLVNHFYRYKLGGLRKPGLWLLALTTLLAFGLTTPYLLVNFQDVIGDILAEGQHYSAGHAGMEGDSFSWYLNYLGQTAGLIYAIAILEIGRGLYHRSQKIILLAIFPIFYFIFISSFVVRNDRTILPLTPFLFLLAASFLVSLWPRFASVRFGQWWIVGFVIIGVAMPLARTIRNNVILTTPNSRETARLWLADYLPDGDRLAIEAYSPYIDPARFSVQSFYKLIDHPPNWYVENGFDYLVFSQGMFGRFYLEPQKYGNEIAQYEALFAQFTLLKQFNDGGYEVRIYQIR